LLDWGTKVDPTDDWKDIPLHDAARSGYLSVVKLLVERGADVRLKDNEGSTLLHDVAFYGHLPVVKLLVDSGAYVSLNSSSRFPWNESNGYVAKFLDTISQNKEI